MASATMSMRCTAFLAGSSVAGKVLPGPSSSHRPRHASKGGRGTSLVVRAKLSTEEYLKIIAENRAKQAAQLSGSSSAPPYSPPSNPLPNEGPPPSVALFGESAPAKVVEAPKVAEPELNWKSLLEPVEKPKVEIPQVEAPKFEAPKLDFPKFELTEVAPPAPTPAPAPAPIVVPEPILPPPVVVPETPYVVPDLMPSVTDSITSAAPSLNASPSSLDKYQQLLQRAGPSMPQVRPRASDDEAFTRSVEQFTKTLSEAPETLAQEVKNLQDQLQNFVDSLSKAPVPSIPNPSEVRLAVPKLEPVQPSAITEFLTKQLQAAGGLAGGLSQKAGGFLAAKIGELLTFLHKVAPPELQGPLRQLDQLLADTVQLSLSLEAYSATHPNEALVLSSATIGLTILSILSVYNFFFGGYSGDLQPAKAREILESDPNAFIVDIRAPDEREAFGVPDLRRGARGKQYSVPYIKLNAEARRTLNDPRGVELQILGAKIADLRMNNSSTSIIILGSNDGTVKEVARAAAFFGAKRTYRLKGGMGAWVQSGLGKKSPAQAENLSTVIQEEVAEKVQDVVKEITPSRVGQAAAVAGAGVFIYLNLGEILEYVAVLGLAQLAYSAAQKNQKELAANFNKTFSSVTEAVATPLNSFVASSQAAPSDNQKSGQP
eukprot:jgi/Mesvir1/3506/Mv11988-RA.2